MSSTCSTNRETGRDQFSASQAAAEGPAASCSNTLAPAAQAPQPGRLGQHPGALAAAVADAYRAFGAQGAAQQEQHLCRQLFPNGAPEDPTVGKGGGPRKGTGGQAGAQPHPVAHHPRGQTLAPSSRIASRPAAAPSPSTAPSLRTAPVWTRASLHRMAP